MTRLQFLIRQRRYKAQSENFEWAVLVACLIGVALTLAIAWAKEEKVDECYYSTGREVERGKWVSAGDEMVCIKR